MGICLPVIINHNNRIIMIGFLRGQPLSKEDNARFKSPLLFCDYGTASD